MIYIWSKFIKKSITLIIRKYCY